MKRIKQWLVPVLVVAMVLSCTVPAVAAEGKSPVSLTAPESVRLGAEVEVQALADEAGVVADGVLVIRYDAEKLTYAGTQAGPAWNDPAKLALSVNSGEEGKVVLAFASSACAKADVLFTLRFTSKGAGEAAFAVADGYVSGADTPAAEAKTEILTPVGHAVVFDAGSHGVFEDGKTSLTVEVADGEMKLIAVDGSRLAVRCEKIATEQEMSFIVPAKAMSEVIKLMGEAETVSLSVSNRQIVFAVNGYDVVSRLLEGEFINYKRTIPPTTSTKVIANTADMIDTVERISQVIVERLRTPVTCRFEDGVFHATCTTELGNAQDEMPVKMEGESMTIGCNSRFLIDALRAAETDEIEISMSGPVSPIVIRPTQGDAFLFIVLPVRIK